MHEMKDFIEKWQAGDEEAFEALFQQYKNLVFKTALAMNGDSSEAEDVLQEVFTKAWKSRQSFNPRRGKLTTWLSRITVNECINKRRKRKTCISLEMSQDSGFQPADVEKTESGIEAVLQGFEHKHLMGAVHSMNVTYRAVIVLRYYNELSYHEIAEVLGIPLGTVKSRLNEAMKILRRALTGGENSEM
jgi:RNA polymerase sigma-70 factor (ECF subfamily)